MKMINIITTKGKTLTIPTTLREQRQMKLDVFGRHKCSKTIYHCESITDYDRIPGKFYIGTKQFYKSIMNTKKDKFYLVEC